MLFPSIYNRKNSLENLFDQDFANFFNFPLMPVSASMKTDIKETDEGYELSIEMPGFQKDNIQISLNNGYMTVSASMNEKEENDDKKKGSYIRKERTESCSRSFFVGDKIKEEDVKARFENGILSVTVPKAEEKQVEEKKLIQIEG